MARSFVTTPIVDPVKAPISKRSLTHINAAWDELGDQLVRAVRDGNYTTNDVVIMYGCVVTANIPGTSSVTAGAIYYNGRVYYVDAASISTPSNTLVWNIDQSYISGDPATFSDGSTSNFHLIEKFKLVNAISGSGIANYNGATIKYLHNPQNGTLTFSTGWANDNVGAGTVFRMLPFGDVELTLDMQISTGGSITVGTVPAGFVPANAKRFMVSDYNNSDGASELCILNIASSITLAKQADGTKPANRSNFFCTIRYNIYE